MSSTLKLAALATVFVPVAAALAAGSAVFDLEIGDPERKGRQVAVVLDGITDTTTGELLTPQELAERLADTRILLNARCANDQRRCYGGATLVLVSHRARDEAAIRWFRGSTVSSSGLGPVTLYLELIFRPPNLGQVIACLPPQPELRVGPACLFQAQSHFRRNPGMSVQDAGKRVPGNTQYPGSLADVKT